MLVVEPPPQWVLDIVNRELQVPNKFTCPRLCLTNRDVSEVGESITVALFDLREHALKY